MEGVYLPSRGSLTHVEYPILFLDVITHVSGGQTWVLYSPLIKMHSWLMVNNPIF